MHHGGDLDEAARLYGIPPQGWLDLSTGINPRPYPVPDGEALQASLARLPTFGGSSGLLANARRAFGVRQSTAMIAAPGTEILIRQLPGLLQGPVAILRTSCRSYRKALPDSGRLRVVESLAELVGSPDTSVIVVNPNDPDGRICEPPTLLSLARGRSPGGLIVVDEAYADCTPGPSVVPLLRPGDPVLVLRSFGNFFGLPGLRLGFAIGPKPLITRLAARLGDWPVSGPALEIGSAALADEVWRRETIHWLGNQAQALDSVLRAGGMRLAGGCRLFRTGEIADAPGVQARLARQGIWACCFEDWPGLVRFGLPSDGPSLRRLADALAA